MINLVLDIISPNSMFTSPAFSMGAGEKKSVFIDNKGPGPNQYDPMYTKVKPSPPGVNFGSPGK
jgi:hypothetical protein